MLGVVRLLALTALVNCVLTEATEFEHVPCPCDSPGAFLQLSEPDVEDLVSLEATQQDMNSTGAALPDGSLDFTDSQPVNTERDSVCVCKRMHRPKAPVRCTRGDLLHHDCNERDQFRANGFEVAPDHLLTTLYPDEIPQPAGGKVFQDELVEKSAVKNLAVEDTTIRGYTTHIEKSSSEKVLLSSGELKFEESPEEKPREEDAVGEKQTPETDSAASVKNTPETPTDANENAGGLGYDTPPSQSVADVDAAPEQSEVKADIPAENKPTPAQDEVQQEEKKSEGDVPSGAVDAGANDAAGATAESHAEESTSEPIQKSPETLAQELQLKTEETEKLKQQLAMLEGQMEKLIKGSSA